MEMMQDINGTVYYELFPKVYVDVRGMRYVPLLIVIPFRKLFSSDAAYQSYMVKQNAPRIAARLAAIERLKAQYVAYLPWYKRLWVKLGGSVAVPSHLTR